MTIKEAQAAARECVPVVFHDPMLDVDMVFSRIIEITKTYMTPDQVRRGYPAEAYYLTLDSMRCPGHSQHVCPPELVRLATPEDVVRSGIPLELEQRQEIEERAAAVTAARAAEDGEAAEEIA